MSFAKTVRTIAGYSVLAIAVTIGGVALGATVVAPVVAPVVTPVTSANVANTNSNTSVSVTHLLKDFVRALPAIDRVPKVIWLVIAGAALLTVLALVAWKFVRRSAPAPASDAAVTATAALPEKLVLGKSSRTPRAVVALAEAGTAPADIARRTGLSLDAVVLCLAMSPIGARQLRPPTA